jgi:hypothetical protein
MQLPGELLPFLLLVLAVGCSSCRSASPSRNVLSVIGNSSTTTSQLTQALEMLRNLKMTNEPPRFWSAIANNPEYRTDHRRRAVLQLLARHFHSGMTCSDIARLLDHPDWLDPQGVTGGPATGPRPPGVDEMDGLAIVNISCGQPNPPAVWLRFTHGYMGTASDLYWCLEGKPTNKDLENVKIDDVISSEEISGHGQIYNAWGIPPKVVTTPAAGEEP